MAKQSFEVVIRIFALFLLFTPHTPPLDKMHLPCNDFCIMCCLDWNLVRNAILIKKTKEKHFSATSISGYHYNAWHKNKSNSNSYKFYLFHLFIFGSNYHVKLGLHGNLKKIVILFLWSYVLSVFVSTSILSSNSWDCINKNSSLTSLLSKPTALEHFHKTDNNKIYKGITFLGSSEASQTINI